MRTGIANFTLDYGKCPKWLFERMTKLARIISLAIIEEFGVEEFLKRLSDPVWFQSFGCVLAFDWNSSGLTVTTTAALKESLRGLEAELGIFVCGGKGKTSRKTPEEIKFWGKRINLENLLIEKLVYSSKMAAKVDSCLIRDGFQIYHHSFIFDKNGNWAVIQQGMNILLQKARRYHWYNNLANSDFNFINNPHQGIVSQIRLNSVLNLTSEKSQENRQTSFELIQNPKTLLSDLKILNRKSSDGRQQVLKILDLENCEFSFHKILKEKFQISRLKESLNEIFVRQPNSFEAMLATPKVGPKTIRALSLIAEIIYGAKPSYEDPARYSFAHGGKDGTPYEVDRKVYDKTIDIMEKALKRSHLSFKEKSLAISRVNQLF